MCQLSDDVCIFVTLTSTIFFFVLYQSIAYGYRYNVHVHLHLCQHYVLVPYAADTLTKFARQGELYARLDLRDELSEDTKHGRLILENVTSVTLTFTHQTRVSDTLDDV